MTLMFLLYRQKSLNSDIGAGVVDIVWLEAVTFVVVKVLELVVLAVQPQADVLLLADHGQLLQHRHPHALDITLYTIYR